VIAQITFVVLVGATFAAFFVAQRLKSAPSIIDVKLTQYFSPNGDGRRDTNRISLYVREPDEATIDIVDIDGDRVRRLAEGVRMKAHSPYRVLWDGRADDGARAPDGRYRVRVALRDEGRSAIIQKTMTVDTRPPRSMVCVGAPCDVTEPGEFRNIISQGDTKVPIYIKGVSRYQTRFKLLRTDQGAPREVFAFQLHGKRHRYDWNGRTADGKPLEPGTYIVQAQVRDTAKNIGITPAEIEPGADIPGRPGLTVRGLTAQPPLRPVTAGARTEFFVDSRSAPYRWRVRRVGSTRVYKRGSATAPNLVFHAPEDASGLFLLELRSGRWHTSVPFLVQATKRSSILVVVPTITWLGTDKVDDSPFDGVPNTLAGGGSLRWPRMFVGDNGLPAGWDDVAQLLVFLDRRKIRYDLTSDLDLDLTRNPRASDRKGVLLAGSERWVTRSLGRRLRTYVTDGGKLAMFGADSLRRGVRLRVREDDDAGTLSRATEPAAVDPFGARIAKQRRTDAPVSLAQYDGQEDYGLMEGALTLSGFTELEEAASLGGGKLLAAVGEGLTDEEAAQAETSGQAPKELRPALSAVQLGKGTVIRVGLPEWSQKLGDPDVAQVTRNIVDILRGVPPRIRSEGDR
jgi:flagellar hook assembly protein FlgD